MGYHGEIKKKYYDKKIGIDIFNDEQYREFVQKCLACEANMPRALAPVLTRFMRDCSLLMCDRSARLLHELTGFDIEWDVELCSIKKDEKEVVSRLVNAEKREKDEHKDSNYWNHDIEEILSDIHRNYNLRNMEPIVSVTETTPIEIDTTPKKKSELDQFPIDNTVKLGELNSMEELQYNIDPCTLALRLKMKTKSGSCIGIKVHSNLWCDLEDWNIEGSVIWDVTHVIYWLAYIVNRYLPGYEPIAFAGEDDEVKDPWDAAAEEYAEYREEFGDDRDNLVRIMTDGIYNGVVKSNKYEFIMKQSAEIYANVAADMYFNLTADQIHEIIAVGKLGAEASADSPISCGLHNIIDKCDIAEYTPNKLNGCDSGFLNGITVRGYYKNDYVRDYIEEHGTEPSGVDVIYRSRYYLETVGDAEKYILWTTELQTDSETTKARQAKKEAEAEERRIAVDIENRVNKEIQYHKEKLESDPKYWVDNFDPADENFSMQKFVSKCKEAGVEPIKAMLNTEIHEMAKYLSQETHKVKGGYHNDVEYQGMLLELNRVRSVVMRMTRMICKCIAENQSDGDYACTKLSLRAVGHDSNVELRCKNISGEKGATDIGLLRALKPSATELIKQAVADNNNKLPSFEQLEQYTWSEAEHKYITGVERQCVYSNFDCDSSRTAIDEWDNVETGKLAWELLDESEIALKLDIVFGSTKLQKMLHKDWSEYDDVVVSVPMTIDLGSKNSKNRKLVIETKIMYKLREFIQAVNVAIEGIDNANTRGYLKVPMKNVVDYVKKSYCSNFECTQSQEGLEAIYQVANAARCGYRKDWFRWNNSKAHTLEEDYNEAKEYESDASAELYSFIIKAEDELSEAGEVISADNYAKNTVGYTDEPDETQIDAMITRVAKHMIEKMGEAQAEHERLGIRRLGTAIIKVEQCLEEYFNKEYENYYCREVKILLNPLNSEDTSEVVMPCASELVKQAMTDNNGKLPSFNTISAYRWDKAQHKYIIGTAKANRERSIIAWDIIDDCGLNLEMQVRTVFRDMEKLDNPSNCDIKLLLVVSTSADDGADLELSVARNVLSEVTQFIQIVDNVLSGMSDSATARQVLDELNRSEMHRGATCLDTEVGENEICKLVESLYEKDINSFGYKELMDKYSSITEM